MKLQFTTCTHFNNHSQQCYQQDGNDFDLHVNSLILKVNSNGENDLYCAVYFPSLLCYSDLKTMLKIYHSLFFFRKLYDIDNLFQLKKRCNETTSCTVRSFDFDKFPKHVKDMNIRAYKPIAIQVSLFFSM